MKKIILITSLVIFVTFSGSFIDASQGINLQNARQQREKVNQLEKMISFLEIQVLKRENRENIMKGLESIKEKISVIRKNTDLEIIETTDDPVELVVLFSKNITLENFEIVCNRSKDVKTKQTKEVLNKNRTGIVTENKSLYEVWEWCQYFFDENERYIFLKPEKNHKIELLNSDADDVRAYKVKYNQKIKEVIENYSFYSFMNQHPSDSSFPQNPADHLRPYLNPGSSVIEDYNNRILKITTPKEIIKEVLGKIKESEFEKNMRESAESLEQAKERVKDKQ